MSNPLEKFLAQFVTDSRQEIIDRVLDYRTRHLTVVLENMYQTHNSSACLRSCDCFGWQDAHIIENDHDFKLNRNIAVGGARWLTLHRYKEQEQNTFACFDSLKSSGYKIVAATADANDCVLSELDITSQTAIVFGSEQNGLSDIAKEHADGFVRIPMYGFTESYNVSVACALVLSDLTNRLHQSEVDWRLSSADRTALKKEWYRKSIGYRWPELEAEFFKRNPEFASKQVTWSLGSK